MYEYLLVCYMVPRGEEELTSMCKVISWTTNFFKISVLRVQVFSLELCGPTTPKSSKLQDPSQPTMSMYVD